MEALFRKLFTGKLKGILSAWGELDEKAINFSEGLTLEGLTLKSRDLPGIGLRVKGGFIKQLSVKVPWKRLKKESVRVEVKELFVILGPRAVTAERDGGVRGAGAVDADRRHTLEEAAKAKRKKLEENEEAEDAGYFKRMMKTIVDNLMVNIGKVTVVVEQDDWKRAVLVGRETVDSPPAFRLRLELSSVAIYTCDRMEGGWRRKFMDEAAVARAAQVNKECVMRGLSIRMCDQAPRSSMEVYEHVQVLQETEELYGRKILRDMNLTFRLISRISNEESDVTRPKLLGQVQADAFNFELSRFQYVSLLNLSLPQPWKPDELRPLPSIPRARPIPATAGQPNSGSKQWWRFAGFVVLHNVSASRRQSGLPISWKYFGQLVLSNRPYVEAWKAKLRGQSMASDAEAMIDYWEQALCCDDILYFRRLAGAEREAEDTIAKHGSLGGASASASEPSVTSMKSKLQRKLRKGIKEVLEIAEGTAATEGTEGTGSTTAREALAVAEDARRSADAASVPCPAYVWTEQSLVGEVRARIPAKDMKIGTRYYGEHNRRVVRTSAGGDLDISTIPLAGSDADTSRSISSGQSNRIAKSSGASILSAQQRYALYVEKGFCNDGERGEVSSTAKTSPEYVHQQMLTEIRKISIVLLAPDTPDRSRAVVVTLGVLRLKAQMRSTSLKLEGDLQSLKVDARAMSNGSEVSTDIVELKRPKNFSTRGALARFNIDTLTHRPEVSARVGASVAGFSLYVVPAPIASLVDFFAPASTEPTQSESDAKPDDDHSPSKDESRRARLKKTLGKAKHTLSTTLTAGQQSDADDGTPIGVSSTRNTCAELAIALTSCSLILPEEIESDGEFTVWVDSVVISSEERPLSYPGMFENSCTEASDACLANARVIEEFRQRAACQNVRIVVQGASVQYGSRSAQGHGEHGDLTICNSLSRKGKPSADISHACLIHSFNFSVEVATVQCESMSGPPQAYTAATVKLPALVLHATPEHASRLVRLWSVVLQPLFPQPPERSPIIPPRLKTLPVTNLSAAIGSVTPKLRLWIVVGAANSDAPGESGIHLCLNSTASAQGSIDGCSVAAKIPCCKVGFLLNFDETRAKDTYLCAEVGSGATVSLQSAGQPATVILECSTIVAEPAIVDPTIVPWSIHVESASMQSKTVNDEDILVQYTDVHAGRITFAASPASVTRVAGLVRDIAKEGSRWPSRDSSVAPSTPPAVHGLLHIDLAQLAMSCEIDAARSVLLGSGQHLLQACMSISDIKCMMEMSSEPATQEAMQEFQLTIAGMALTLTQNGEALNLLKDVQGSDGQYLVRLKFTSTCLPPSDGQALASLQQLAAQSTDIQPDIKITQELNVELRMITILVYPSLIRLLYETHVLLSRTFGSAGQSIPTQPPAAVQPSTSLRFYAQLSHCELLCCTKDPAILGVETCLVIGFKIDFVVVPPSILGSAPGVQEQLQFIVAVEALHGFTGRLGADGSITQHKTFLEPVDCEFECLGGPSGCAVDLECGKLCAKLDGKEASELLSVHHLLKVWAESSASAPIAEGEIVDSPVSDAASHDSKDREEEHTKGPADIGEVRIAGIAVCSASVRIPCVRISLATGDEDVAAIAIQTICVDTSVQNLAVIEGEDSPVPVLKFSIESFAIIDCYNSEGGLCVMGGGSWAEQLQEPALISLMEEAEEQASSTDLAAITMTWNRDVTQSETGDPPEESSHYLAEQVNVEIGPMQLRLTPRFGAACVNWASSVWDDREIVSEELIHPANAQECDWIMKADYCMESTVTLGDESGSTCRRIFIERSLDAPDATVVLSGGKLSVHDSRVGTKQSNEPLVFVADGVNFVLQDVDVTDFDPRLISLGPGATVSGSLTLDGSEIWEGAVSTSTLRQRWKRNRHSISQRSVRANVRAHTVKLSSVHEFGSLSCHCVFDVAYVVKNHHSRVELDATKISIVSEGVEMSSTQLFCMDLAHVSYDTSSIDGRGFVQIQLSSIPIVISNKIGQAAFWAAQQWQSIGMQANDLGASVAGSMSREARQRRKDEERQRKIESSMSTFMLTFACPELELLLLNDTSSLQNGGKQLAARLTIKDISANSHRVLMPGADAEDEAEEQMHNSLSSSCTISMDVMNQSIAAWEPLCESFSAEAKADKEGPKATVIDVHGGCCCVVGVLAPSMMTLSQDATEGSVQISVTAPMMNLFQHTVDHWLHALSQEKPHGSIEAEYVAAQGISPLSGAVEELCSDLLLKNDLPNIDLRYWRGTAFHPIQDEEPRHLSAGQEVMLNVKYASATEDRIIHLEMEGCSKVQLQVEKVGSDVHSFISKLCGSDRHLIVSCVQFVGEQKVVSIRSPVYISNRFCADIRMQLITADGQSEQTILNGSGASLPSSTKSMRIRPERPGMVAVYGWSPILWSADDTEIPRNAAVTCVAAPGLGELPHVFWIRRNEVKNMYSIRDVGVTIQILSPLILSNALPVPLDYMIYDTAASSECKAEGTIESGSVETLCTISCDAYVQLRTEGVNWSARHAFKSSNPVMVDLPDAANRILTVRMQASEELQAGNRVSVWCPFWVVNYTGLRLRYASDDTIGYTSFAGPDGSDAPGEPFMASRAKISVQASANVAGSHGSDAPANNRAAARPDGRRNYETGWSKAFSLTTVGTSGVFSLTEKSENGWRFDLSTAIHLGTGRFSRTKVVVIRPQYNVTNQLMEPIHLRQVETDLDCVLTVAPGATVPLYWPRRVRAPCIVMRLPEEGGSMWSAPVDLASANNIILKIRQRRSDSINGIPNTIQDAVAVTRDRELDSEQIGTLQIGQVVEVLEKLALGGVVGQQGERVNVCYRESGNVQEGWINECSDKGVHNLRTLAESIERVSQQGFLEKMGEVRSAYKKRFFVFTWPYLHYYESKTGVSKGAIDMRTVTSIHNKPNTLVIELVTASRTHMLKCSCLEDVETWKQVFLSSLVHVKSEYRQLRVDTNVSEGCQNLMIAEIQSVAPPYLIHNHTDDLSIWVTQKLDDADVVTCDDDKICVLPHQSCTWFWPQPAQQQVAALRFTNCRTQDSVGKDYILEEITEHKPIRVGDKDVIVLTRVRDRTKICHIYSKVNKPRSGDRSRPSADQVLPTGATASLEGREMTLTVSLPQLGLALVGNRPDARLGLLTDIVHVTVANLSVEWGQQTNGEQKLDIIADDVQIDNGNWTTPYPVVFKQLLGTNADHQPHLRLSILKCSEDIGSNAYKMIQIMVQESNIVVDEELVAAALMFVSSISNQDAGQQSRIEDDYNQSIFSTAQLETDADTIFYCEFLDIGPIKCAITYASTAGISLAGNNPLLDALANVDAAPLKLNALMLQDTLTTQDQLIERIGKHYKRQGVIELYKLMGTADLLGNPIGLVNGVASGVVDFFYEPGSALFTNPSEFGSALGKGTMALVGGTIGGTMNTVSKMTGAVGKGLTTLTMDDSYITERRSQAKSQDAVDGMKKGVEHFGSGLMKGVTGLVTNPYKEGKKGGAAGFMRGMGKGLIGAVVKPAAGVLDLASDVSSGIMSSATMAGSNRASRTRPPRAAVHDPNDALVPYNIHKARAAELVVEHSLHKTLANQIREKMYYHTCLVERWRWAIVTNERVLLISPDEEGAARHPDSYRMSDICNVNQASSGTAVEIQHTKAGGRVSIDVGDPATAQSLTMLIMKTWSESATV